MENEIKGTGLIPHVDIPNNPEELKEELSSGISTQKAAAISRAVLLQSALNLTAGTPTGRMERAAMTALAICADTDALAQAIKIIEQHPDYIAQQKESKKSTMDDIIHHFPEIIKHFINNADVDELLSEKELLGIRSTIDINNQDFIASEEEAKTEPDYQPQRIPKKIEWLLLEITNLGIGGSSSREDIALIQQAQLCQNKLCDLIENEGILVERAEEEALTAIGQNLLFRQKGNEALGLSADPRITPTPEGKLAAITFLAAQIKNLKELALYQQKHFKTSDNGQPDATTERALKRCAPALKHAVVMFQQQHPDRFPDLVRTIGRNLMEDITGLNKGIHYEAVKHSVIDDTWEQSERFHPSDSE